LRSDCATRTHSITGRSPAFVLLRAGASALAPAVPSRSGDAGCGRHCLRAPSAGRGSAGSMRRLHPAGQLAERTLDLASAVPD
jgi:hypothetical protein